MARIGFITIGQAPRDDIMVSMFGSERACDPIQTGALDAATTEDIICLAPHNGEHPLVSRLRNGEEVVVAKERLIPRVQHAMNRAVDAGATVLTILCTGEFVDLSATLPIIYPDRILVNTVNAILPTGALGVMLPHPGQEDTMRRKWAAPGRTFLPAAVSPYTAHHELAGCARDLRSQGADMIVLDCMGFTQEMKRVVAEASGLPTILANRLVGRVIEELIDQ